MAFSWSDKRVVITGGTGFLGTHLTERIRADQPAEVLAFGEADYDLRERDAIQAMLRDTTPDVVIHLAARVGGIGANRGHPADFFYDNLTMGVHLVHECWKRDVEKIVLIGTVCAYPKVIPIPFKEDTLWDGYPEETNAPYGLAKKMLLVQSQAYRQQYGYNSIFLLPVNLYGPGDNFDHSSSHVIPAIIRKCIEAKEANSTYVEAWGDGSPTREHRLR